MMRILLDRHRTDSVDLVDGIKVYVDGGFVLVRPDPDEPAYHVVASVETPSADVSWWTSTWSRCARRKGPTASMRLSRRFRRGLSSSTCRIRLWRRRDREVGGAARARSR